MMDCDSAGSIYLHISYNIQMLWERVVQRLKSVSAEVLGLFLDILGLKCVYLNFFLTILQNIM